MKSWKTTASGICAIVGGIVAIVQPLVDNDPTTVPNFAVAWASIMTGIGLIFAKDFNVTGTKAAPSTPESPPAPPAGGFARIGLLLALLCVLIAGLSLPRLVRADDPVGGACWDTVHIGKFCLQPNVAVGLVEVNLDSGKVTTGLDPVLGYEATAWGGKVGLGIHLGFRGTSSEDERILPMIGLSAFQYLRLEVGKPFKGDGDWRAFVGLGTSLGSSSSST